MAYSATNKEKIKYYKDKERYEFVKNEYLGLGKTNAQLAEEWDLPSSTVYSILKYHGLIGTKLVEKVTTSNEELFDIHNPIFCYIAGLISADGYIDEKYHRVCLRMNVDAREILERLRLYFQVSNPVAEYTGDGGFTHGYVMYDLTISSKKLLDELRKLNIYGRKKDLLTRFPDMSLLTDECQEMYIRGLWDGDGSIVVSSKHTFILEESKLMILAIKNFLDTKLNIDCTYSDSRYHNLYIGGHNFRKMGTWMYRHNLDCCIKYKYINYLNIINN